MKQQPKLNTWPHDKLQSMPEYRRRVGKYRKAGFDTESAKDMARGSMGERHVHPYPMAWPKPENWV